MKTKRVTQSNFSKHEREEINMKKKVLATLLSAIMVMSMLSGCGNSQQASQTDGTAKAESTSGTSKAENQGEKVCRQRMHYPEKILKHVTK